MKTKTPLRDLLTQIGLNAKEGEVYLLLLELGTQPAATLAKRIGRPKSTVLFLCNRLVELGYARKSFRGRTQFFSASPEDLEVVKTRRLEEERSILAQLVPLLNEYKNPFSSEPRVTFYQGIEGCRKAYLQLLASTTEILEFGVQRDLVTKLGEDFIAEFIRRRVKQGTSLRAIANSDDVDRALQRRDVRELRQQRFFSPHFGRTYSSIAVYEGKVLLLNLHSDPFAISIDNRQVSETLRTIFSALWEQLPSVTLS